MAAVQQNYDYNFDMFDVPVRSRGNTAAAAAPARKTRERAPLKAVPKKTNKKQRQESQRALTNSAIILIFAVLILGVLCLQISAGAKNYEASRKIAAVEAQIEAAKSENVRLNSEKNSVMSIGKIDEYATNVLGMTKVENYQVEYIDLSEEDGVLFSSGGSFLDLFSHK